MIQAILQQPATNSINAAYRPIIIRVQAISTTYQPAPPVVYCDIYVNGTFYKSIVKSQYTQLNETNSEWQFDIQDIQEILTYEIPTYGDYHMLQTSKPIAVVFCRFRASYIDDDGLTIQEDTAPIQATSSVPAQPGSGFQSNSFIVVNATLRHEDNQDLATHLNSFKIGNWGPKAFPLTHRPKGYLIGRNNSDHFPFLYTGILNLRCIKVNLHKRDGTTESKVYCFPLPPCTIAVTSLRIDKVTEDLGDSRTYYYGTFNVTNTADHYLFEVSTDDGATWANLTSNAGYHLTVDEVNHVIRYNALLDGTAVDHRLRVTAYCDATNASAPITASYTVPVCGGVSNLTVGYNSVTQQFTYNFADPDNKPQAVSLLKDGVAIDTRNNAPNSGSWTISQEGDYSLSILTTCDAVNNITKVDNSDTITVTISNPVCNAPYNVNAAFSPDGNSITGTWQVIDTDYSDLVKWYNADTNDLLVQGVVAAGIHTANIGITQFPNVQRFYFTVQHQCPAPSTVSVSNILQRISTYLLTLDFTAGDTVKVKCTRYGQAAPAPFNVTVNISLTYTLGGGGTHTTTASNILVQGQTEAYIYGSSGITITAASINSISPSTNGTFSYTY